MCISVPKIGILVAHLVSLMHEKEGENRPLPNVTSSNQVKTSSRQGAGEYAQYLSAKKRWHFNQRWSFQLFIRGKETYFFALIRQAFFGFENLLSVIIKERRRILI